jgi:hypothetical protein
MAHGGAVRLRRRQAEYEARRRQLAVVLVIAIVAVATLLVTAFGGSDHPALAVSPPASATSLLPAGPPGLEVLARIGTLRIQLPINASRVTAIGYHGGTAGSLALSPLGAQANQGLIKRLWHTVIGGGGGQPRWYQLPGGQGPATSALDVGASPGTDVYSPVDGTVVGIDKVVVNGTVQGASVDIQPTAAPSLVVSVSQLNADPSLGVGMTVTAGGSKLGTVRNFALVESQALARYTNDAGNHVLLEVHAATTLQVL